MFKTLITSRDPKGLQTMRLLEAAYDKAGLNSGQAQYINEQGDELISGFEKLLANLVSQHVETLSIAERPPWKTIQLGTGLKSG